MINTDEIKQGDWVQIANGDWFELIEEFITDHATMNNRHTDACK